MLKQTIFALTLLAVIEPLLGAASQGCGWGKSKQKVQPPFSFPFCCHPNNDETATSYTFNATFHARKGAEFSIVIGQGDVFWCPPPNFTPMETLNMHGDGKKTFVEHTISGSPNVVQWVCHKPAGNHSTCHFDFDSVFLVPSAQ